MTFEELREARLWLADCVWRDVDAEEILDPAVVSDARISRAVERHYDGGLRAFVLASGLRPGRDGHGPLARAARAAIPPHRMGR